MQVCTAIALINEGLVFKPGWKLVASASDRHEGCVKLDVYYPARASDREEAVKSFPTSIEAMASFPILTGTCRDQNDLLRQVVDILVSVETHEIREFLRLKPTYTAPFHPHRLEGMKRWGDMAGDLSWGTFQ